MSQNLNNTQCSHQVDGTSCWLSVQGKGLYRRNKALPQVLCDLHRKNFPNICCVISQNVHLPMLDSAASSETRGGGCLVLFLRGGSGSSSCSEMSLSV